LLTVATAVSEELQVTALVRSLLLPSSYWPVATYCQWAPKRTVVLVEVTYIETKEGTVTLAQPLALPEVAVIAAVPIATPLAIPRLPGELPTVATAGLEESQVATVVKSLVLPSLNVPMALNCRLSP